MDSADNPELYAVRRRKMVERQLAPRGIRDKLVLEAMGEIPRELFVDEALRAQAYSDSALPIGHAQTISQPFIAARMTELIAADRSHRILEIGTGSGYQTALLARLAGSVHSIERVAALAEKARRNLELLGFDNVEIKVGDGTVGWPERAPFDRILVAAGSPEIPRSLLAQLAPQGRLLLPVGGESAQILTIVDATPEGFVSREDVSCVFVRLIGAEGWPES